MSDDPLIHDSGIALQAGLNRLHDMAVEYRDERDSARANLAALQKCVDDADLVQLFDDLIEFLDDQADADGDSEGFYPNKAMRLSSAVARAAQAFGWEA